VPFTLVHTGKTKQKTNEKIQTIHKLSTTHNKQTTQNTATQNTLVQSPLTTLGQETRWTYSTTLSSPHGVQS